MRSRITTSDTHTPRAGFSLVELLVVMAIIATLASLSFVVLGRTGEAAREAATRTELRILSGALRERVDAFHELTASASQVDPDMPIRKNTRVFRDTVDAFNRWFALANPLPALQPHPLAAEAYVRKTMFKSLFPQRVEDLFGYNGISNNGGGDDSPMLARMYQSGTVLSTSWLGRNITTAAADSSELLYLTLTEGDVYGLPPSEIDGIDKNLIGDTDGDGNMEFLDGWGRPLQFYNWPTRLIKDDGVNYIGTVTVSGNSYPTTSLLISNLPLVGGVASNATATQTQSRNRIDRDPEDPLRSLTRVQAGYFLLSTSSPATFNVQAPTGVIAAQSFYADYYHDPNTATMPLVVSAGPDGDLGLYLPTVTGANRLARVIATAYDCQALGDNLTNQQRGPN